ncbi:MAG: 5'/3'-nucleotidase SurE, partial [Rhodospirillales bacterium]
GKRYTRLGRRKPGGEIVERTDPAGRPYYWIGSKRVLGEVFNDTDIAATDQGYISVTPLTYDLTDKEALSKVQPSVLL